MKGRKKAGVRTVQRPSELKKTLQICNAQGALYSLFHHTNVTSFANMVKGGSIRLSRIDTMNDGTEVFKDAKRTYAFCLSATPTENAGMWIAYGLPRREAIRVRFPGKALHDICKANKGRVHIKPIKDSQPQDKTVSGTISLQYVGYVSHSGIRVHVRKTIYRFPEKMAMPRAAVMNRYGSFIKLLGWEYEHEIRLVIRLDEEINAEKIQLDMPDVFTKILKYKPKKRGDSTGMPSVIVGPWGDPTTFEKKFRDVLEGQNYERRDDVSYFLEQAGDEDGLIRESEFKGKIRLNWCATCDKKCSGECVYYVGETK